MARYPAEPYRIKTVEHLNRLPVSERREHLERAAYNVALLPQEAVFLDFGHFRGLHAMSDRQWSGMLVGDEAYAGSRNFYHILDQVRTLFGKSWVVPLHRGRGGFNLLAHGYLQQSHLSCGPLTEVERYHFTRFGTTLHPIPWEVTPSGTVGIHVESWSPPEEGVLYWRLVSPATGFLPSRLEDVRALLEKARERGLKVFLNASSALRAYGDDPLLRDVVDLADVVLYNAREDAMVHTGALVMGQAEENYLIFRTYVVVFEGLHTYGGLAGRDMEALARGLQEAREGIFFQHHQEVLDTLRQELRDRGFPLAPYPGVWGVEITTPEFAPTLQPSTAVYTLQAALYLLSGIRVGRRDKNLWIALPLRRYTADHLHYLVEALETLRDHLPLVADLELLNRPRSFQDEEARFAPLRPFLPSVEEEVISLGTIPPYRIKHVEITLQKSREAREKAIQEAGYNTFLLRSEDVYIDLLTDSGTSAQSADQWAELLRTPESLNASRAFEAFREAVEEIFGMPFVVPTHQGRAAEHILSQILIRPGQYVINNMYFTTTREHQERAGGIFVDLITPEAHDPTHPHPFKGDLDLEAVVRFIEEKGPENIAYICLEMNVNMAGGQPVSLRNTRKLAEIARSYDIPLIFDATRSAENAYLIQQREEGQQDRPVRDILKELMSYADGLTFSAKKDVLVNIGGFAALRDERLWRRMTRFMRFFEGETFNGGLAARDLMAMAVGIREMVQDAYIRSRVEQTRKLGQALIDAGIPIVVPVGGHAVYLDARRFLPHLEQRVFPAQRLAAEIYVESGVRTMERGTVSAGRDPQTGDHRYPKLELVRITLPRRVYTTSHMDVVVEGILRVWDRRERIPGLRMVYEPPTLRFFTARFESL